MRRIATDSHKGLESIMTMNITRWDTGAIIYSGEATAMAELLTNAVNDHVNCYRASLVGASLDGASLVGASLDGASLDRASLDGASLDGARLVGASLDGARLVGASLDGASLDRASLVGARLDGALIGQYTCAGPYMQLTGVAEWGPMVAYIAKDTGLRVIIGCRHFSIAEAHTHWERLPLRFDRKMTRVALAMAETWAAAL